jgi:hypothetical protein
MWQDIALSLINFGFIITLIPAIIRNYRVKDASSQSLTTYFSTAVLLTIMLIIYFSLDLNLSGLTTAGTALMWYMLTYQKIKYQKIVTE